MTCVHVALVSCVMMPWLGSIAAEADERLERRRRIDAVDIDLGEVVVEAPVRERRADAHLPLQLAAVAHRGPVDVGLMQVLVEQQVRIDAAGRRRDHGAARAIRVDVDVGRLDGTEIAELHDVVAAVDLLVELAVAGADDVACVGGQQVRDADTRLHGRVLHPVNVEQLVEAAVDVDAHAAVDRQALARRPGVLRVEGRHLVVLADARHVGRRTGSQVEREVAGRRIDAVDVPIFLQEEAVVDVLGAGLADQARVRPRCPP